MTPDRKIVKLAPAPLTVAGLESLKELPGLTDLHLSNTKLTDAELKVVGGLTGLKKFSLRSGGDGQGRREPEGVEQSTARRAWHADRHGDLGMRALPRLRVVYTNLWNFDPQSKTKLAECKKALPRATIHGIYPDQPLGQVNPFGGGIGGFGGGIGGGFGGGGFGAIGARGIGGNPGGAGSKR